MFKILYKQTLAPKIDMMVISAPYIARHAKAGNFVVIRLNKKGERIPLTIADADVGNGTITLLFQKVGKTTEALGMLKRGGFIRDIAGPLGHPTPITKYGDCVLVAGGVGGATLYPIIKALKETGNNITFIMGARSKEYLIWEEKFKKIADECIVTTDDGSYGRKGLVTDVLKEVIQNKPIAIVVAVGPVRMMKAVSELTKPYGIKTIVSLNPLMVEGTGMCGACRVNIAGKTMFACIDGPEFDGHEVDFQVLENRLGFYKEEEEKAYKLFLNKPRKGKP
ncbi:MAG: sulfide/dihydroorotate dehydrogenase-like FAD/NAD-binding protein [Nitrospirae bacterium]|nr:sulfide/dihydroorotate dehydrogenase-like FAD/NAD-binding protein [Nitrospirota bacterium]